LHQVGISLYFIGITPCCGGQYCWICKELRTTGPGLL